MKRDFYFDNLKFLLIFCVVLGHLLPLCNSNIANSITIFIYYFHMPLFIFISGFFSKRMEKNRDSAMKIFIIYLVVQSAYSILYLIVNHSFDLLLNIFEPINTLWYLLALFIWRYFLEDLIKIKHILIVAFLLFIMVMFINGIGSYLALQRTFGFMIFFLLGYYADYGIINKFRNSHKLVPVLVLIGLWVLTFFLLKKEFIKFDSFINILQHKEMIYSFSSIYIGIITYVLVFAVAIISGICLLCICPENKYFVSELGMRTLPIYVCHALIPQYFGLIIAKQEIAQNKNTVLALCLVLSILILLAFGNKFFYRMFNLIFNKIYSIIFVKDNI